MPLAILQDLAGYWAADYDWRRCEAKLNVLPQFVTEIDGLDIHFIQVRSCAAAHRHARVARLDYRAAQGPLTNPTAHGASASDAFDLVIPSLPGYGYSAKPTDTGWDPERVARAWVVLVSRLGYPRFAAEVRAGLRPLRK